MEKVTLTHAEVITLSKDTKDVIRENKTDRGTLLTFKTRTRVNDRVQNSPFIYRTCTFSADTQDAIDKIKEGVKEGAIIEIQGRTDKYNSRANNKWVEVVRVNEVIVIVPQQLQVEEPASLAQIDIDESNTDLPI
jgi:hypothetical protein